MSDRDEAGRSLGAAARSFGPFHWWAAWYEASYEAQDGESIMCWVYRSRAAEGDWEVGFYDPAGEWHRDGCYGLREKAAARCRWLNGGT